MKHDIASYRAAHHSDVIFHDGFGAVRRAKVLRPTENTSRSWEGIVKTYPSTPEADGKHAHATLRVTSMGNALLHEMRLEGRPDNPITMLYMDDDRLTLTHYCDAGNRPRMVAKASPDGKTVEFDFVDVAGSTQCGHMHHAVFTVIDASHHTEDWTFMVEGKQGPMAIDAHFDLHKTN